MKTEMQSCLDACLECYVSCNKCEAACLQEEHVKDLVKCIELDHQCSLVCELSIHTITHNSEFALPVFKLCEDVCNACAEECSKHKDDHCRECAEACKKCAEECRKMSEMKW